MSGTRRTFEETCATFAGESNYWAPPRDAEGKPWLPDHHAGIERDDRESEPVSIMFFRSGWEDKDFSNLTLPRSYMNRSTFERLSFVNTDLNQSFMCWNDFTECDFTDADLTCCDMRSSIFRNCKFVRCRLIGADLQRSSFEGCDFTDADLTGARVDDCTTDTIEISTEQDAWLEYTDAPDGVGPQPSPWSFSRAVVSCYPPGKSGLIPARLTRPAWDILTVDSGFVTPALKRSISRTCFCAAR
jgi:hypothetical protein